MRHLPEEEKTLPLTFVRFISAYHVNCNTKDSMAGYFIYLKENDFQHRYGEYKDRHQWLQAEMVAYLSK